MITFKAKSGVNNSEVMLFGNLFYEQGVVYTASIFFVGICVCIMLLKLLISKPIFESFYFFGFSKTGIFPTTTNLWHSIALMGQQIKI